jgi:large repetitive protein
VPVSFRDWTGREITRVYSDQFGNFNALVPSTFSMNLPMPSGAAPNMLTACMNSPMKPVLDANGNPVVNANGSQVMEEDPMFKPQYSQFCYTFQYMPGKTTYLDTPVVPVAAFAGQGQFPLDCELPNVTPVIATVDGHAPGAVEGGASLGGPWIPRPQNSTNPDTQPRLHITSAGMVDVPNPAYDGSPTSSPTIPRDFGFGADQGDGSVTFNGVPLPVVSWTDSKIVVRVPRSVTTGNETSGQLMVQRDLDTATPGSTTQSSVTGITLTIGGNDKSVIRVAPGGSIQAAIDAAPDNGSPLILVPPGTYEELVIMHKPVRLQGWGAFSTKINAVKAPAEKLASWRAKLEELLAADQFSLLPGQEVAFDAADNEPVLFGTEEGPGILVVGNARNNGTASEFGPRRPARIDGISITGADHGGGILVSGYANNLQVSNNRIISNHGTYGGGVRIGHAVLLDENSVSGYTDSQNDNVQIFFNQISQNGSSEGAGGGIAVYTGADGYQVRENTVCGNFSLSDGGGIGHLGLSDDGTIANNQVLFNQTFNQGVGVSGGGIFVGGAAPIAPNALSQGSGDVDVGANLIKGNQAGAGDGGGFRSQFVNGTDVQVSPNDASNWYRLNLHNNIVVDNMAGLAGGGISLQDSARVSIVHNTVANNDSTATAGAAFEAGSPNQSTARPAGIVARAHSDALSSAIGTDPSVAAYKTFSNPTLDNNIVWHNRSFYWAIDPACDPTTSVTPCFGLQPVIAADGSGAVYDDLAVRGTTGCLNPRNSILTVLNEPGSCPDDGSNLAADPLFVAEYVNGSPGQTIVMPETTTSLATAAALDEGGNFIDVRFGPLTLTNAITTPDCPAGTCLLGDYHLQSESPAQGLGATGTGVSIDVDGDARDSANPDSGADEL